MSVRLGGGQGFYGDTPRAVEGLLADGIDYLCLEALAELTLAILAKDRARDETLGYTRDLPRYLTAAIPAVIDGSTKIITNAGGINPRAAAHAAIETAKRMGVSGLKIATVLGDDLMPRLNELQAATSSHLSNMDTGAPYADAGTNPLIAAAYLGAFPIADALSQGADVVITGRVADAALFLGPLIHEHGWAKDDWDQLAAGVLVGHLLECSGQVAGGNFSGDWWTIPEPWKLPYPIATVDSDGSAIISKPSGSGGRVDLDTVRHQLLYEVHDPSEYLSPDVVADFGSAIFEDLGDNRVAVRDVRGKPATGTYKALIAHHAGWSGETRVAFAWPDAVEKARATAAIFTRRVEMAGLQVREWCFEEWGVNALGGPTVPQLASGIEPPECVLRVAWRCDDERTASAVGRELIPLALSAPPAGLAGMGRATGGGATELISLWPTLVDKHLVDSEVRIIMETS